MIISCSLHRDVLKTLDDFCKEKGFSRSGVIKEGVLMYMDSFQKNAPSDVKIEGAGEVVIKESSEISVICSLCSGMAIGMYKIKPVDSSEVTQNLCGQHLRDIHNNKGEITLIKEY